MKMCIIVISSILIIFIVSINIYIITANKKISSQVEDYETTQTKITMLDSFRTNVVYLGHMFKSYLLTGDTKYNTQYANYLSSTYTMLDDLLKNGAITNVDNTNIKDLITDYENTNSYFLKSQVTLPLNTDAATVLAKSDEIQINILHSVSFAIASHTDSNSTNLSSSISSTVSNQKKFIQIISSFFTIVMSCPVYFIIKKYNNGDLKLDPLFNLFSKYKTKTNTCSNISTYSDLVIKHNQHMKEEWKETENLISTLENSLQTLKASSVNANDKYLVNSQIQDIEVQLVCLKLKVNQLLDYHEYISQLTDGLMSQK